MNTDRILHQRPVFEPACPSGPGPFTAPRRPATSLWRARSGMVDWKERIVGNGQWAFQCGSQWEANQINRPCISSPLMITIISPYQRYVLIITFTPNPNNFLLTRSRIGSMARFSLYVSPRSITVLDTLFILMHQNAPDVSLDGFTSSTKKFAPKTGIGTTSKSVKHDRLVE